jgi:thiamine transporter ThiT
MVPNSPSLPADTRQPPEVWAVVRELARHPVRSFVTGWNWKAAVLSAILRVPVYVITTIKYGWRAATLAGLVEAVFSSGVAGVYASFTEAVRNAVPQSVVALLLLVVLPAITLGFDGLFHYLMGTPNLVAGISVSLAVSIVSSAFNWYSMRHGTLLIGPQSRPFSSDLTAIPVLIGRFLLEPFALLWRTVKMLCAPAED